MEAILCLGDQVGRMADLVVRADWNYAPGA